MGSKVILAFVLLLVWMSAADALNKFPKMASLETRQKVQVPWEPFPEAEVDSYDGVPDFGDFPFDFEDFPEMKNFEGFPEMESYDGVPNFGDFPFDFEDFPEMKNFKGFPEMKNLEGFPEMESYDGVPDFGDFPFDFKDFPEMENFDEVLEMEKFEEFPEIEKFDEEFPEMENFDEEFPEMENFDEEFPEMEKFEDFPVKEDYQVQNEEQAIKQRKKLVNGRGSRLISMEEGFGAESSKVVGKLSVESETREKFSDFGVDSRFGNIEVGSGRRALGRNRYQIYCQRMRDLCRRGISRNACSRLSLSLYFNRC